MPMTPSAAKKYKPRREPGSLNDVVYPETRAKMQEAKESVADAKASAEAGAEYDKATTVGKKNGGYVRAADGVAQRGKTRGKMC